MAEAKVRVVQVDRYQFLAHRVQQRIERLPDRAEVALQGADAPSQALGHLLECGPAQGPAALAYSRITP